MTLTINSRIDPQARACIEKALAEFPEIQVIWTYAPFPDHSNGRCCDFMITIAGMSRDRQVALGDAIAAWHKKYAKELGVNGVIWNRRVMGFPHADNPAYRGPYGEWRHYTGPKSHTDHVHVEYDGQHTGPGAPAPYKPNTKATVYLDRLRPGVNNSDSVAVIQKALIKVLTLDVAKITVTGDFTDATFEAAKAFQALVKDDVVDGKLGPLDVAELLKRAKMTNPVEAKS